MATRDIVPRADGEGEIGTTEKMWLGGHFKTIYTNRIENEGSGDTPDYCLSSYTSWAAAIAAIGSNVARLIVDTDATVSADSTVPSTLMVRVYPGCIITVSTTKTLTINGVFDAGLYQVFSCVGSGSVSFGSGSVIEVYPEWWGIDGTADDVQIQSAVTAFTRVVLHSAYATTTNISLRNGSDIQGINNAQITSSAAGYVFSGSGTQNSHLNNIKIRNIKFIGIDDPVTVWAIQMNWVDNLVITDNETLNFKLCKISNDGVSFALTDISKVPYNVNVDRNKVVMTNAEDGSSSIQLRYMKYFSINNNIIIGATANSGGAGLYIFGGNSTPTVGGDAVDLSLVRKAFGGVINDNVVFNQVSGVNISQCSAVTSNGNTYTDCGEAIWVAASKDITVSGNTVTSSAGGNGLQVQGICENIIFDANTVKFTTSGNIIYVGHSVWLTDYNIGPIIFTNNILQSTAACFCSFIYNKIGHLIVKNNYFKNIKVTFYEGGTTQLEIENNSFIYDVFYTFAAQGSEAYSLMRLSGINTIITGMATSADTYASIRNNIWFDQTMVDNADLLAVIRMDDPGSTSTIYIERNTFKTKSDIYPIQLLTTSATLALTTVWNDNITFCDPDFTGGNSAVSSCVTENAHTLDAGLEMVLNGAFASDLTGWTVAVTGTATVAWDAGTCVMTDAVASSCTMYTTTRIALIKGHTYRATVTFSGTYAGIYFKWGFGSTNTNMSMYNSDYTYSAGTKSATFVADGSEGFFYFLHAGDANTVIIDNVSLKEIPLTVNGDIYLTGNQRIVIPTHANNAAAIAGGLVAGQFYRVNAATDPEPIYIVH